MKNLQTTLLFIILSTAALWAQTPDEIIKTTEKTDAAIPMSAGSRFLGLNGTGGLGRGVYGRSNLLAVTGQGGYFVANRLAVGLQVSYGKYYSEYKAASLSASYNDAPYLEQNSQFLKPEVFTRYYLTDWKVKPFVQLSAGWNFQLGDVTYLSGEKTRAIANGFTAGAGLGVSFKLGKRANIDLMYNQNLLGKSNLGNLSGLRIGVTFLLNKR